MNFLTSDSTDDGSDGGATGWRQLVAGRREGGGLPRRARGVRNTSTEGHEGKEGLTTDFTDDKKGGEWRVARVQGAAAVQTEDTCRMNGRVNHGTHESHGRGGTGDLKFHNLRFEIGPVARGERILLGQWNHDQNILQKQTKAAKAE